MSPCKCSDPYALLTLLYGADEGRTAGETLRRMLPASSAPAAGGLTEASLALSAPPQSGLKENELLIHDVDLLSSPPGQPAPDYHSSEHLLAVTKSLLEDVQRGARLIRLKNISRAWGDPPHQPQNVLILGFLRAALLLANPNALAAAELEAPLAVRAPYFGNGENAAHLIETGELPWLLLDAFARGKSGSLQAWVNALRLPITAISYLHRLTWPNAASASLAAEVLSAEQITPLQTVLNLSDEQAPSFLTALTATGEALSPQLARRRTLATHAALLSLTGLPALDSDPDDLPGLAAMLRARAASPAFSPWGAQVGLPCGDDCLGLMRIAPDGAMALCLTNLSVEPQTAALDAAALGFSGEWQDLLSGEVLALDGEEWRRLAGYQSHWWVAMPLQYRKGI
ncbi:MAG: hypothetical protein RBT34_00550 [Anaerolineaceae bacterium]|jgi:hypothetical protein|nr:hypothetical protein [Anaerolineaceae bacterium]